MSKKPNTPEPNTSEQMTAYIDRIIAARDHISDTMLIVTEKMQALKDAKEILATAQQKLLDEIYEDDPRLPFVDDTATDGSCDNGRA